MSEYLMKSGEIKTDQNIYRNRGNKSIPLPKDWKPYHYDSLGIEAPVLATPKPTPTSLTKTVYRDGVTTDANGNTVQNWAERDMFSDYVNDEGVTITKAGQEATYLETLKLAKRKEMKSARDADISTTTMVTVPSGTYEIDCDQVARSNLHQSIDNAEIAGLTDADTTQWKMADNSFVTVSYGELKSIGLQIAQFISSKYTQEAMKNVEIDNATFATIESITWE